MLYVLSIKGILKYKNLLLFLPPSSSLEPTVVKKLTEGGNGQITGSANPSQIRRETKLRFLRASPYNMPEGKPTSAGSALDIFSAMAKRNQPKPITIQGICQNVLVSIHTDENCVDCANYALHIATEVADKASSLAPIPHAELEKALTTAFPDFMAQFCTMNNKKYAEELGKLQDNLV